MSEQLTYAPEIEAAMLGILWREPERLAVIKRELDPAVHFVQPALRWILEAMDLAYRELGTVDFASVIQVLRELGKLEEAGGLEGANEIWAEGDFLDSPVWQVTNKTQVLFDHYLGMLKSYAQSRQSCSTFHPFTSGKFQIFNNKLKCDLRDPDVIGQGRIAGRNYELKGWTRLTDSGEEFLQCQLYPKS